MQQDIDRAAFSSAGSAAEESVFVSHLSIAVTKYLRKSTQGLMWWHPPVIPWKAEVGGLWVQGQLELYSEFEVSLSYILRSYLKNNKKEKAH
jgi:hypothetical protein